MDLDQKLEGFAEYANEDVRALFNSFNTDEDRKWAWAAVCAVRRYFPKLNHRIVDKNKIQMISEPAAQRLKIIFNLNNCCLWLNGNTDQGFPKCFCPPLNEREQEQSGGATVLWWIGNAVDEVGHKNENEIEQWVKYIHDNAEQDGSLKKFQGKGLMPSGKGNESSANNNEKYSMPLNTILYGPPGTGKTYHTINKALEIIDPDFYSINKDNREALKKHFDKLYEENKIVMTTFHQSYAYEDFVEGLSAESIDGKLVYGIKKGVFKTICENAEKSPDEKFVLIIDEINRGNVSNIFGELITLIEDSKRAGKDEALSVTLPYSKENFSVPSNLYIVGTMNTADRSLTQIDTALRRRFHFKEMMPDPTLLDSINIEGVQIGNLLRCLNARIETLYDREHTLGHAFFMELCEKDKDNIQTLAKIFKNKIIPLLQEYFFDDWGKIQLILGEQVIKEKSQFSNFATSNTNNIVIPKAYKITDNILEEPTTYMAMYANCIEHIND